MGRNIDLLQMNEVNSFGSTNLCELVISEKISRDEPAILQVREGDTALVYKRACVFNQEYLINYSIKLKIKYNQSAKDSKKKL